MRTSKYNAALLGPIVKSSRTLAEVLRRLGLPATGGNYRYIAARLRHTGIDASHLRTLSKSARCAAVPPEQLAEIVARSTSVAQVLTELGLPTEGRSHRDITRRIRDLALDTSHLQGRGWARGQTKASHPALARASERSRFSNDQVFVENSSFVGGAALTPRLLAMGWAYRCSWCEVDEWRGKPLVLHLDHINDNRLVNLRLLCPSQTETYGNRRR